MSYTIDVLNPSLTVDGELSNIKSVEIYEVINNQYVADVEIAENIFPSFLHYPNMLEIDNDYFNIADIDKQRDSSKSINISLEHVSYLLNDPTGAPSIAEDEEEEYEGTIQQIINNLWGGMGQFTFITDIVGEFYYRPGTTGGRSRIQEFARQNGFEVEYNKFNIIIHHKRGSNKGLELRVGKNVKSVTQKISLNDDFYVEYAHEVDIVDFSKMPVKYHEDIASADIGDTVRIIDTDLAIDATERIVAKRYSPLFKEVPKISVGQVIRDIVDVINKEEEEEEKDDPTANYFLSTFKVGQVDCLKLSGIEMDFESVLPEDVSTGVDYLVQGEHKGVSIALKSQYSNYHATVTKFYEDGSYTDFNLSDTSMQSWNLPEKNLIALIVTVSQVPWDDVDLEIHKAAVYGVTFNKSYIEPLREFKIGKQNVLKLDTLIDTEENLELEDITATIDYNILQDHKGMKLSIKSEFKDYTTYITLLDENGLPTQYEYEAVKNQIATWNFPRDNAMYLLVTVQEKPTGEFDATVHNKVMYGVKFEYVPIDPLREFKIDKYDVLNMNALIDTKGKSLEIEDITASLDFIALKEYEGVKLSLKQEFKDYHTTILTFDKNGIPTVHDYDNFKNQLPSLKLPTDDIWYFLVVVSEAPAAQFNPMIHKTVQYGVKFEKVPFEPLTDFKIGETDCLALSGVSFDVKPSLNQINAEVFYGELNEHQGLLIKLKREYKNFHTTITTYNSKGVGTVRQYEEILNNTFPTKSTMFMTVDVSEVNPNIYNPSMHSRTIYAIRFTEHSDEATDVGLLGKSYHFETGVKNLSINDGGLPSVEFEFTRDYQEVNSVTLGFGYEVHRDPPDSTATAYWAPVRNQETGMWKGVLVSVIGLTDSSIKLNMHAICVLGKDD